MHTDLDLIAGALMTVSPPLVPVIAATAGWRARTPRGATRDTVPEVSDCSEAETRESDVIDIEAHYFPPTSLSTSSFSDNSISDNSISDNSTPYTSSGRE